MFKESREKDNTIFSLFEEEKEEEGEEIELRRELRACYTLFDAIQA